MKRLYVEGIGLAAPGMEGWVAGADVLRGNAAYVRVDLSSYQPALLPPNERRRATAAVRLAFRAAEDALKGTSLAPSDLASVFTSSDGDLNIVHRINTALLQPARNVSPTDFHNSVHNAAAGYWSIAVGSRLPSTSIAAHDASFSTGLLEAATLAHGDGLPVLLVGYDVPPPQPIAARRVISEPLGVALVLTPEPGATCIASLGLELTHDAETPLSDAPLEALRTSNPAGRALPVLQRIARNHPGTCVLPSVDGGVSVSVTLP